MRLSALLVCLLASGCGAACASSPDIQVTLLLDGVDRSAIAQFRLGLTVGIGSTKYKTVPAPSSLGTSLAVLLQPDTPPAQPYSVALVVEALDPSNGVEAIGSTSGTVSPNGCNRLQMRLTPLPMTDAGPPVLDLSSSPDLTGPAVMMDLATSSTDILMACSGGTPDEDADGRADFCDVCAADADPTPTDSDGDGVPDACDPDKSQSGNRVIYFEPFNSDSGHWSTSSSSFMVVNGSLNGTANPHGSLLSSNSTDAIPDGAMVETYWTSPFLQGTGVAAAGLFLGDQQTQNGALCTLNYDPMGMQTVDLDTISNGAITNTKSSQLPFGNDVTYRLRLTQRGNQYTCEGVAMVTPGPPTATATATINGPAAPRYLALRIINLEVHFLSVFAVTAQ